MTLAMLRASALLAFGLLTPAALAAQDATAEAPAPDRIVVTEPGIRPEGIEWDAARGRFLLGSLADGVIRAVDDAGQAEAVIDDPDITVSAGIEVDAARDRLLVTNGEATVFFNPLSRGLAGLAAYDLATGERLFFVDLGALTEDGRHFANDVAVDADGNAYVTDSFSPLIYRVTPDGEASIFLEDERLGGGFLGLNGIAAHPDGYLLVSNSGANALLKVPLDSPEDLTVVETDQPVSLDGMILAADGTLYAINNAAEQALIALRSEDNWASATVVLSRPTEGEATTVTLRGGIPFFINAYLMNPMQDEYPIEAGPVAEAG